MLSEIRIIPRAEMGMIDFHHHPECGTPATPADFSKLFIAYWCRAWMESDFTYWDFRQNITNAEFDKIIEEMKNDMFNYSDYNIVVYDLEGEIKQFLSETGFLHFIIEGEGTVAVTINPLAFYAAMVICDVLCKKFGEGETDHFNTEYFDNAYYIRYNDTCITSKQIISSVEKIMNNCYPETAKYRIALKPFELEPELVESLMAFLEQNELFYSSDSLS